MKKYFKLLIPILIGLFILIISNSVQANSISKISMDIFIDENGNAEVTEVWNCAVYQGTEAYHPYYNLGTSEISNLRVSENDKEYETLSIWKTSGTLDSKAYKCGINNIPNGIELCWGINDYGHHTYTVKYNISNFVSSLNDSQMIYWTLIPYDFSEPIGNVYIKIHTGFNIDNTTGVWGYGNLGGTAYVYDGYIEMQTNDKLEKSEYMTILVKFPSGTFNTSNHIYENFDYYLKMAEKDSVKYQPKNKFWSIFPTLLIFIIPTFIPIFIAIVVCIYHKKNLYYRFNSTFEDNKIDNVTYFRDLPCNNDLYMAYYIAHEYKLYSKKTDLFGSIILKLIKDGFVNVRKNENGKTDLFLNSTEVKELPTANKYENRIYKLLYYANNNGVIDTKKFKKICKKEYSIIYYMYDGIINSQKRELADKGLLTKSIIKKYGADHEVYHPSDTVKEYARQIAGLKKFLLDYTLLSKREPIEVHLFEDYMIYAQMLGIADKVAKAFKDIYPELVEQSVYKTVENINYVHIYSSIGTAIVNSAKKSADFYSRADSYSSGGGGYSSGGGGGGSFGGGGGGGGFR